MGLTKVNSGGIEDGSIVNADLKSDAAIAGSKLADNAVGLAQMAGGTDGQIITYDASGDPVAVGPGTDGQVLTSTGAGSPPAFESVVAGAGKNLLINGNFLIAQRSGSMVGITGSTNSGYQTLDRWGFSGNWGSGAVNVGQSSDTPNKGFSKSYKVDVTTAYAGANGVTVQLWQKIEAQNLASCGWDYTSSSSYLTLSFWVKSPKTGTHAVTLETYDGDSQYRVLTYSVSSANTWEKKSIQIPGGSNVTIDADAQVGMTVYFMMTTGSDYHNTADAWSSSARFGVTGQVNILDNTSNDFYLTGVQLETGSSAKDFDHHTQAEEKLLCQRYYTTGGGSDGGTTYPSSDGYARGYHDFKVEMRAQPTMTFSDGGTGGSKVGDSISNRGFFVTYGSLGASGAGTYNWTASSEL